MKVWNTGEIVDHADLNRNFAEASGALDALDATTATITTATIGTLSATNGTIGTLSATNGTITTLAATSGAIPALTATTVKAGSHDGWLESLIGGTESAMVGGGILGLSPTGASGGIFGLKASDAPNPGGMSFAVGSFAINNNVTDIQTNYAAYFEARRYGSAGTTQGLEVDVLNIGPLVGIHPFAMGALGSSLGLWLTSGRPDVAGVPDATAAIGIANNGARWGVGIVFGATSLTIGGGVGQAIQMAPNHAIMWHAADGSATAFIQSVATVSGSIVRSIFTDGGWNLVARNGTTAIQVVNGLNTLQSTKISGTLEVTSTTTFDGDVNFDGNVAISSAGLTNFANTVGFSGHVTWDTSAIGTFANDAAAATGGVFINQVYRNSSFGNCLKIRES